MRSHYDGRCTAASPTRSPPSTAPRWATGSKTKQSCSTADWTASAEQSPCETRPRWPSRRRVRLRENDCASCSTTPPSHRASRMPAPICCATSGRPTSGREPRRPEECSPTRHAPRPRRVPSLASQPSHWTVPAPTEAAGSAWPNSTSAPGLTGWRGTRRARRPSGSSRTARRAQSMGARGCWSPPSVPEPRWPGEVTRWSMPCSTPTPSAPSPPGRRCQCRSSSPDWAATTRSAATSGCWTPS